MDKLILKLVERRDEHQKISTTSLYPKIKSFFLTPPSRQPVKDEIQNLEFKKWYQPTKM